MTAEPTDSGKPPQDGAARFNHFAHVAGHVAGILYILVTLLFGPIKSLAVWLARQELLRRYKGFVAQLPPSAGFALSLFSLSLLELSKILVLLAYHKGGLFLAALATLFSKISFGYLAHTTWHAARHNVITAYPRIRAIDAWVVAQIALIKSYRDRILVWLRAQHWYPAAARLAVSIKTAAAQILVWFKEIITKQAGNRPKG